MKFSHSHYEAVAEVIRFRRNLYTNCIKGPRALAAILELQGDFSSLFAKDNPNFKPERFAKACEPDAKNT